MKPLTKGVILLIVLVFYSLLYIATKPRMECDEACQKLYRLDTTLINRFNYFLGSYRCTGSWSSDTLCVRVKDTLGIDWNRFADTICLYGNSVGLYQQKVFVIRERIGTSPDTVARKQCP